MSTPERVNLVTELPALENLSDFPALMRQRGYLVLDSDLKERTILCLFLRRADEIANLRDRVNLLEIQK